jgi:hypothetical protein
MLRARCLSAAMRAYCPDVIGSGVYVEGEIESVAAVEEPAPVVRSAPQSIEDAIIEAEASCGPPEVHERAGTPVKLLDCGTPAELEAWIAARGADVLAAGDKGIAKVAARATQLRCVAFDEYGESSSLAWVQRRLAALVTGTEAA